jgi:hypothetical protein
MRLPKTSADACERVLDLVRDDRRHLAQPGQRGLLAHLLFQPHARAQIVNDAREFPRAAN